MHYSVTTSTPERLRTGCLILGVVQSAPLEGAAKWLDDASGGVLSSLKKNGDLEGKSGQVRMLHKVPGIAADRILMVGCGRKNEIDDQRYRKVVNDALRALSDSAAREAAMFLAELPVPKRSIHWKVRQAVETSSYALYRFDQLKSERDANSTRLGKVALWVPARKDVSEAQRAAHAGHAIANGVNLARDLGNLPANICTPTYLASRARALAKRHPSLKTHVLNQKDMEKLGMGNLLSVARGSREPPKLITVDYGGGPRETKPVVLVGKGVTFDSGGISIKSSANLDEMKFDMCGAASVLGTLEAVAQLKLPIKLVGIIPATENLPDGNASKPGDVVKSMSGQTVEILNTDAEGRLILSDALTYADRFKPDVVIDIATLTGACVVALGGQASGLFANDPKLAEELIAAGELTGDRAWPLPLWDEYQDQLKSNFADMANIGGRDAGAITAACFLSRYTKSYRWAHMDIAGTAWKSGKDKGATGRPVTLLSQFLLNRAEGTGSPAKKASSKKVSRRGKR